MAEPTSKEVAARSAGTVATRETAVQKAQRVAARYADLIRLAPTQLEGEGATDLADRIMSAETIEDLAGIWSSMDNAKTVVGVPLMFHGFTVRESTIEGAEEDAIYLTVDCTRHSGKNAGEPLSFNTGAATIVLMLLVAYKNDWLPFTGHIEAKGLRKSGFTAYNLVLDA